MSLFDWKNVEVQVPHGYASGTSQIHFTLAELILEKYWEINNIPRSVIERSGLDAAFYANRQFALDEVLPWDIIDCGVTKEFLAREYKNALCEKTTPNCREKCSGCGLCAQLCPMGSIDAADFSNVVGKCIKCCACVKKCPTGAKYFDHEGYLYHQHELEDVYGVRRAETKIF